MRLVEIIVGGVVLAILGVTLGSISAAAYYFLNADVYVEWSGPQIVTYGDMVSYELRVRNNGPDNAEDVSLNIIIPSDFQFVWRDSTSGCRESFSSIECHFGRVTTDQSRPIRLTFYLPKSANCVNHDEGMRATLSSQTNDPNTANNTVTMTVRVLCSGNNSSAYPPPYYSYPYHSYYSYPYSSYSYSYSSSSSYYYPYSTYPSFSYDSSSAALQEDVGGVPKTWGGGLDDLTHPIFLNIGTKRKYRASVDCREDCFDHVSW